jgi:dihydropteroate synthase
MTEITELVGILNVTPDSFSDGGRYEKPEDALQHAEEMFVQGAAFVDVGAESTAPNSPEIDAVEEWKRLKPILPRLIDLYPDKLSLDTRHPETAGRALHMSEGRVIINDMTSMTNQAMIEVIADYGASCIIGHIPGDDVHKAHEYHLDSIQQVIDDLLERKARLVAAALRPERIILDPGIGFGKTPELNVELLKFAEWVPAHRVMIGASKKRFIETYFAGEGQTRYDLYPNLRAAWLAIDSGAAYLRVHDVAAHQQLLD